MFELQGKFNTAKIMIDSVDAETQKQIHAFLSHPAFAGSTIRIMPDCHAGKGSCVGYTATMNDYIIPAVIGVDIGCGIDAYNVGKVDVDFAAFDKHLRDNVPSGFNGRDKKAAILNHSRYDSFFASLEEVCNRIGKDYKDAVNALGTLGGGNHFIELDKDPDGNIWLAVHSGSRNFGLRVANFHQAIAAAYIKEEFAGASAYKGLEYLVGAQAVDYLADMRVAQQYAVLNRMVMADELIRFFGKSNESIHSIHNYINFDDKIVRKGAISAHAGERLIIPLTMADGIIVGRGKGNVDWNFSAPHGAGRVLSRGAANRSLSIEDYQDSMKDVWSSCVNKSTLDEAPMAYKSADIIKEAIKDTVDIEFVMKPVYNFKASE